MRRILVCALALLTACDRGERARVESGGDPDASLTAEVGGDVTLTDGSSLQFPAITSDRYKQWDAAQQAFDRHTAARYGAILQPESPTSRTIERAVSYLRGVPAARAAIERTGMTVRDFVLMTVALEQQMRLAETRGEAPSQEYLPLPFPAMLPEDSLYVADSLYAMDSAYVPVTPMPPPVVPAPYPAPMPRYGDSLPVDTGVVVPARPMMPIVPDTLHVRRDSTLRMPTAGRDSLMRRDSVIRRDTLARPKVVLPPLPVPLPRDTSRG